MTDSTKPAKSIYDAIRPAPWLPPGVVPTAKPIEAATDAKTSIYDMVRRRGPVIHAGTVKNG
jgi:hypothetical protein